MLIEVILYIFMEHVDIPDRRLCVAPDFADGRHIY